eukprot:2041696-Prymnesium_polylepis.2
MKARDMRYIYGRAKGAKKGEAPLMLTASQQHGHWTPVGCMLRGAHSIYADTRKMRRVYDQNPCVTSTIRTARNPIHSRLHIPEGSTDIQHPNACYRNVPRN